VVCESRIAPKNLSIEFILKGSKLANCSLRISTFKGGEAVEKIYALPKLDPVLDCALVKVRSKSRLLADIPVRSGFLQRSA